MCYLFCTWEWKLLGFYDFLFSFHPVSSPLPETFPQEPIDPNYAQTRVWRPPLLEVEAEEDRLRSFLRLTTWSTTHRRTRSSLGVRRRTVLWSGTLWSLLVFFFLPISSTTISLASLDSSILTWVLQFHFNSNEISNSIHLLGGAIFIFLFVQLCLYNFLWILWDAVGWHHQVKEYFFGFFSKVGNMREEDYFNIYN